jgi:KUP system potassium uptake protein
MNRYQWGLLLGALGVVFGDIGTSPLYALRECFYGPHRVEPTAANIRGVLSLIFWSLVAIVSIKYLTFVTRANNKGEGGDLALLSLAFPERGKTGRAAQYVVLLGVFGAALLYGDGMITPAVTVLSAVEGLKVATQAFEHYIVPITIGILFGLFSFQRIGTGKVGSIFGPVMLLWFATIALLGVRGIARAPEVLTAFNPWYAVRFFTTNGWEGFVVLGAVFLCVTGAEALYADMGHFGIRPIRRGWFAIVFPALILNYLGQGALLLHNPGAAENPFYFLAPSWMIYPLVVLATTAAVIASQALIAGAFSLTMQAIQLGYFPRLVIQHTSHAEKGQIYMPQVNWTLMLASIGLVIGFRSSSNLAAAYGVAVTLAMVVTSTLFFFAAQRLWGWSPWLTALVCSGFFIIEVAFLASNAIKIPHGGWFPLVVGAAIFTLMSTWKTGRRILRAKLAASSLPYDLFLGDVKANPPVRVPGTAVFMSGSAEGTPIALLHNLKHNKVLHERVIILTAATRDVPYVNEAERVSLQKSDHGFYRVLGYFGFMEEPNVPRLLELCQKEGLDYKPEQTTFFLSRETIIPTRLPGMAIWRERLFAMMSRNAQHATTFFRLPVNRVVELGMQVEL